MAGKHELEKFEYLFVDIEWNQTPGTNGIEDGLSTLFQTNFFRLFFRYCTGV